MKAMKIFLGKMTDGWTDMEVEIHSVPSCKERSYKERLVEILQSKEQRLVEI